MPRRWCGRRRRRAAVELINHAVTSLRAIRVGGTFSEQADRLRSASMPIWATWCSPERGSWATKAAWRIWTRSTVVSTSLATHPPKGRRRCWRTALPDPAIRCLAGVATVRRADVRRARAARAAAAAADLARASRRTRCWALRSVRHAARLQPRSPGSCGRDDIAFRPRRARGSPQLQPT